MLFSLMQMAIIKTWTSFIASGGYDNYDENDAALQDRLYLNDGHGKFIKQPKCIARKPRKQKLCSCV